MKRLLLTEQEASKLLSVNKTIIKELIEQNKLNTVEIKPGVIRIKTKSVKDYINAQNGFESEKEYIDVKDAKVVSPRNLYLIFWLTAIIAFIAQIILNSSGIARDNYKASSFSGWLVLFNIGLGIIFFLVAIFSKDVKAYKQNIPYIYRHKWSFAILYLLIMTTSIFYDIANAYDAQTKLTNQTPTSRPTPTNIIEPSSTPKPKTQTTTNTLSSQIDCVGPDGKHFRTTEAECIKFNQAWGNSGATNNNSNNNQTSNGKVNCWEKRSDGTYVYNFGTISKADCDAQYKALSDSLSHFRDPVTGNTMVDCKFTSSDFSFDFGRITYDQCQSKSAAFWKEKNEAIKNRPTIGSQNPNPTSIPAQKTKSQCQEEVRVKYERYQLQYSGSSLEAVNQNYNAEMNACNQYP